MREILFRGKAINRDKGYFRTNYKNGDWVYGLVTRLYDKRFKNLLAEMGNTDGINGIEIDYNTIGQFTGLTDKNGKKIFEGDIIRYQQEDPALFVGIIKCGEFSPDAGAIHATNVGFYVEWDDYDGKRCYLRKDLGFWVKFRDVAVVGNIHDNPELLGVTDNA